MPGQPVLMTAGQRASAAPGCPAGGINESGGYGEREGAGGVAWRGGAGMVRIQPTAGRERGYGIRGGRGGGAGCAAHVIVHQAPAGVWDCSGYRRIQSGPMRADPVRSNEGGSGQVQ